MSSKSKRRVTVDTGNTTNEDSEKRKPSVFERLGPGAGQRSFESESQIKCRPFLLNGVCPYGASCKYKHVQLSSRKSKSREDEPSPEDMRLKLKSSTSQSVAGDKRRDSDPETHDVQRQKPDREAEAGDRPARSSSIQSRRDKDTKIRSQVVVKKSSENLDTDDSGDDSDNNWFDSLEHKKELELEQKRQQLQRELSQLEGGDEEIDPAVAQKKMHLPHSGSDSSPERGRPEKRSSTSHLDKRPSSPPGRGRKEKKKHHTKSPSEPVKDKKAPSPPPDKKEHKKRHDDEEGHKKHKKNKKVKRRSLSVEKTRKDKEEADAGVIRSKRPRVSSSSSSPSPPRTKAGKEKGKGKGKKKKRSVKSARSSTEESPKSKKWLSPLKKTLKLKKKQGSGSTAGDLLKEDESQKKHRSGSPAAARRDLYLEDPLAPPKTHDSKRDWESSGATSSHSVDKRGGEKRHGVKGSKHTVSPSIERLSKRGEVRDALIDQPGRHSGSPAVSADRERSRRLGEGSGRERDASYDRRHPQSSREGRKDDRGAKAKRGASPSPMRPAEVYSPTQIDPEPPGVLEGSGRSRQPDRRDRDLRDDDRRGGSSRDRRSDRPLTPPPVPPAPQSIDRSTSDRYGRHADVDAFDQYNQDRVAGDRISRYDDRGRGEFSRDARAVTDAAAVERDVKGRRIETVDSRGSGGRDRSRDAAAFDRPEGSRAGGGIEGSRERLRDAVRDRGDVRDIQERDVPRGSVMGEGKFGGGSFGGESQRRGGQLEGSRGGEWSSDARLDDRSRSQLVAPSSGTNGGRLYRDDGRDQGRGGDRRGGRDAQAEGSRADRSDGRLDRSGSRLDRSDARGERGDVRIDRERDGRIDRERDRGEGRLERGDRNLDRGDGRGLDRSDSRLLERGEGRLERGGESRIEREDLRLLDRRRDELPLDSRGSRSSRVSGPGSVDIRNSQGRGAGNLSPDHLDFDFDLERRAAAGASQREGLVPRLGERDLLLERDPARLVPPPIGPRDRFEPPGGDFRQDELRGDHRAFRDNLPDAGLRDRHVDDRFGGLDSRSGRRFDDPRDEKLLGRGLPVDDRQRSGDLLLAPRRGGVYDMELLPVGMDPLAAQRRVPLLPNPMEDALRRGGDRRGEGYERDLNRSGRDGRDDRGPRRDVKEGDFPAENRDGRGRRDDFGPAGSGREFGSRSDRVWERDRETGKERDAERDAPRDLREGLRGDRDALRDRDPLRDSRDALRDGPRDQVARARGRGTPTEDPAADRSSDVMKRDRDRSPRREAEKGRELDGDVSKRDRREDVDRARDKADDTRSTRSADDSRDKGRLEGGDVPGKPGSVRGGRDREEGKRSPARSQGGKEKSPSALSDRRKPPKRTRSLSPKQRHMTPPVHKADSLHSPGRARSPGRRGGDHLPSPLTGDRRARSRTPVGMKRKLEEELRSPGPKSKDEARSPVIKRAREESRSPGRKGSRVPSPAGSHHSRGSHSSMEPRRHPASGQREEGRLFGQRGERDSPARRDSVAKLEKPGEVRDQDRKRGRSPASSQPRPSDGADRGRKRWRGDGTWSETDMLAEAAERQKSGTADPVARGAETALDLLDKGEAGRTAPLVLQTLAGPDIGRPGHQGRGDSFGAAMALDQQADLRSEGRPATAADSSGRLLELAAGDGGDDNKELNSMLSRVADEDDYEKISSDESDFEADEGDKQTQNIVSVLDIDWASLGKEATPKQTTGSLLRRFHPATVFSHIGLSRALAGAALFDKVKAICEEGVKVEESKDVADDKENACREKTAAGGNEEKRPVKASDDGLGTKLLSDVPVMHMAAVRQRRDRTNLLRNLGPFRRALCARRDLEIRRQMCKVDKVYEQPADFPSHVMDSYLCKLSIQLFRQGRDFVDRKDSECDGKTELIL